MDQEQLQKAQVLEYHLKQTEQQIELVKQQYAELEQTQAQLQTLETNDTKEILASLGKGLYLPTIIREKRLFVEVGAGVIVRKTPEETKKVVQEQLQHLHTIKEQLAANFDFYLNQLSQMIQEIEAKN